MRNTADDFKQKTRRVLAGRVGWRCSNPTCKKLTCGPAKEYDNIVDIGEAAHICAASSGGKRYDPKMTSEERSSSKNGIWLCRSCAKMIDSDDSQYTVDELREWKYIAEAMAEAEVRIVAQNEKFSSDKEIISFIKTCLDRPAFMDDIRYEGSMENLVKAFEDTTIAINTGILRDRNGQYIKSAEGKSAIRNCKWKESIDNMVMLIDTMRRRIEYAERNGEFSFQSGDNWEVIIFHNHQLADWLNITRNQVLDELAEICCDVGIATIRFKGRSW